MKKILIICLLALLSSCGEDRPRTGELTDFLPQNAAVIVQMQNPDLFFSNLQNNEFVRLNSQHPLFKQINDQLEILKYFPHQKEALLVLNPKGENSFDYTFISRDKLELLSPDSIANKQVEKKTSGELEIQKFVLEGNTAYATRIDSISILSSSKNLIETGISGNYQIDPDLQTAFKAASKKKASVFINHQRVPFLRNILPPRFFTLSNWTVVDTEVGQADIHFNGITVATDTVPHLINVFKGVGTTKNDLVEITPINSKELTSVSFKDFPRLKQNLDSLTGRKTQAGENREALLLENATETGVMELPEGSLFAIHTTDPEAARNMLDFPLQQTEDFRGFPIFEYPETNAFQEILQPLLNPEELRYFTFLNNYILFSSKPEALKAVITAVQNELTLISTEAYRRASESLSSEASLLIVKNNQAKEKENKEEDLIYTNFPITAVQFIYQDDFAHVHSVLTKSEALKTDNPVSQTAAVKLGAEVATKPAFFRNHRTNGMDIAVQDVQNTLYLISPEGKIHWKKAMDSRILGEVQSVDILRNGRYQMAFATQNELHVVDRDGNPVKPFPLKFRDDITQPLSVFDYDNKKDYRFVVVQDNELFMYDRKGKSVKGFGFSKTGSKITQPPKHIRIGRKDYIVVPETSGRLNILNRTGDIRVAVKENLDLTHNKWYEYNGNFVSSNKSGQLIKVTEEGKITREDLDLADNHHLTATERTLVTLSENELNIKGNTVTLDFGLYSAPQIFYINNKIYVSVTDIQAQKIYLLDSNAELLNGFPVYGTSAIDLSNADSDNALELTVQGAGDEVLVYKVR